jgi:hypothetical protein
MPDGGATVLGKAQRYVQRASAPNPDRFYSSEFFVSQERSRLLSPDFLATIRPDGQLETALGHYQAAPASQAIARRMYLDPAIKTGTTTSA